MTESFHIAEWYGRPFLDLSDAERLDFAKHKVGRATMKKADVERLAVLEAKLNTQGSLSATEADRLKKLQALLEKQKAVEKACPFRSGDHAVCTKKGGVCSLRIYSDADGSMKALDGQRGKIRALCPYRFHQGNDGFRYVGRRLLDDADPKQAGEVGFLASSGNLDSEPGEDVGRIDMILVKANSPDGHPMHWCAVEVQAVYFSGKAMKIDFDNIEKHGGAAMMPIEVRRPDYRSSGPKRLMPQLQIKVPTIRRWGKKMAIIVDSPFYESMGSMREVDDVSNADIMWFLVDFVQEPNEPIAHLRVVKEVAVTLESAIEGLTGGAAVPKHEFERRILEKLESS